MPVQVPAAVRATLEVMAVSMPEGALMVILVRTLVRVGAMRVGKMDL